MESALTPQYRAVLVKDLLCLVKGRAGLSEQERADVLLYIEYGYSPRIRVLAEICMRLLDSVTGATESEKREIAEAAWLEYIGQCAVEITPEGREALHA